MDWGMPCISISICETYEGRYGRQRVRGGRTGQCVPSRRPRRAPFPPAATRPYAALFEDDNVFVEFRAALHGGPQDVPVCSPFASPSSLSRILATICLKSDSYESKRVVGDWSMVEW